MAPKAKSSRELCKIVLIAKEFSCIHGALNSVVAGTELNCLVYSYTVYELQNQQEVVSSCSALYMYFPFFNTYYI